MSPKRCQLDGIFAEVRQGLALRASTFYDMGAHISWPIHTAYEDNHRDFRSAGKGLQADAHVDSWDRLRDLTYEGRGA
jgi:hypothetical protein